MRSIRYAALAAVALPCAVPAQAAIFYYSETEPNDSRTSAEALTPRFSPTDPLVTIYYAGTVANEGSGFVDWFSFTVPAIMKGTIYRQTKVSIFPQGGSALPQFVLTSSLGNPLDSTDARTQVEETYYVGIGNTSALTAGQYLARVTITAVPEPTTWALMLAGFALTGYALRRRRATLAFA
jgi:hypothetical protein